MRRNLLLLAGLAALAFFAHPAWSQTANVTWDSAQDITDDTDVSTSGTLVYAYHFGGSISDETVNGVTFSAFDLATRSPQTVGDVTFSWAASGSSGSGSAPFSNLSGSYQAILGTMGIANTVAPMTLDLGGLSIGQTYAFQWWTNYSTAGNSSLGSTAEGSSGTQDLIPNTTLSAGGTGQFGIGTFVAANASESIYFAPSSGASFGLLNAFQLRAVAPVPEPAAWGLLGLGAGALLVFRSRRK